MKTSVFQLLTLLIKFTWHNSFLLRQTTMELKNEVMRRLNIPTSSINKILTLIQTFIRKKTTVDYLWFSPSNFFLNLKKKKNRSRAQSSNHWPLGTWVILPIWSGNSKCHINQKKLFEEESNRNPSSGWQICTCLLWDTEILTSIFLSFLK